MKNFLEWFRDIISDAEVLDYRYPIKGFGVWMPYGFQIRRRVLDIMRDLHDQHDHQEVLFPLLVPDYIFQKEAIHVKGFEDEVFWVTHGGLSPLDVKLALRPTSETAIYPMYKLWVRSHTDLPIRLYQIVNVFRYETKATKPIFRVREITTFKEAHTVHATAEDTEKQVEIAMKIYKMIFDQMGVPYFISKRPDWDKFPGAVYTNAFDCLMPDGKTLQIGTVHNLGQTFSKTFDITYEDEQGKTQLAYQTCYGISERSIGSVLAVHGDDNGLVLPPGIAPIQVVIIPIIFKDDTKPILDKCEELFSLLKEHGVRAHLDKSDLTPGNKFYRWEQKGVPLRVEVGPRDLEKSQVIFVRRDTFEKKGIPLTDFLPTVLGWLKTIQNDLKEAAWEHLNRRVRVGYNINELKSQKDESLGITIIGWCGKMDCITRLKEALDCDILGTPLSWVSSTKNTLPTKCLACEAKSNEILAIGKPY